MDSDPRLLSIPHPTDGPVEPSDEEFRSRSSSINLPNLPIRLALDLSGTNPAGAGGRRASQLVIDQRGVTLKIATNQSGSTLSNSSQPTLASRSNSVITLPPAVAHLVSPPTEAASSTNEIKNENVIEQSMDGGISLTFGQDGELSVCPDGSQTPFVHLKFSPQFLMTNRSRQNSLSSDQPAAISSSSAGPAHSYGHETVGNYSNLVVDLPAMINYATGAPSVDSPSFQHGSSNRRDSLHRLYTSQALVKDAHVRTVPNLHKPSNLYATRHPSLANDYKASPDSLVEPDSILIAKLKQKHVHHIDRTVPKERLSQVLGEMIMPFLLAGLGNVATGWLLFNVQTWPVFLNVPQLIILIPALLGLKGNVEMTLASRLSTHANLGDLDSKADRGKLISGNLALVQCQSSTVGFLAPMIALAISYINPDEDDILTFHEAILLMAASVITANIANLILSLVMFAVIFVCRQMDVNPDNVATPIAASLGDFLTMSLLAYTSHTLFIHMDKPFIQTSLLVILLLLTPVWAYAAGRSKFTQSLVFIGFAPICGAMMLQITGGLIMEHALSQFKKLAPLQPVVNGVGGNLVAIQCSRMATHLHRTSELERLPASDRHWLIPPWHVFTSSKSAHSAMARLLLCLPVPAHLLFLMVIKLTRDSFMFTGSFLFVYSLTAWLQVALLLCLAYGLTHFLWKRGVNPDNWAIPFMTAFADLIGSAMLAVAFIVLFELKDENALHPASMDRSSLTVGQLLLSSGTTSAPFHRFNLHNSTTSAISRSLSETLVALNVTPTLPLSSLTNMWLDSSRSLLLASSPSLPLNVTFTSF